MKKLKDEDPDSYRRQFGEYIKAEVLPEQLEGMWTKAHAAIRKNPVYVHTKKPENPVHKRYSKKKKNNKQRKNRIKQKLAALERAGVEVH